MPVSNIKTTFDYSMPLTLCFDKSLGRKGKERKGGIGNDKKSISCLLKSVRKGEEEKTIFLPNLYAFGEIWLSTKLRKFVFSNLNEGNYNPNKSLSPFSSNSFYPKCKWLLARQGHYLVTLVTDSNLVLD